MGFNKGKYINIFLYSIFLLGLLVTFYIILTDIDTPYAFRFIIGFVIFLLLFGLFQVLLMIMNVRKMPAADISKRIVRFLGIFAFLMAVSLLSNYFFKPEGSKNWDFGIPLGVSLGIAFSDLMFVRKKK